MGVNYDAPIYRQCRRPKHKVVALPSSEAGYVVLAEIVKEVLHFCQVKQFITPNEDNVLMQSFEENQCPSVLASNETNSFCPSWMR